MRALSTSSRKKNDLAARATVDVHGVRWSNHEHRVTPSALEPRTGWVMGNAGIVRELLRFARASTGIDPAYAVPWPDHPVVAPRFTDRAPAPFASLQPPQDRTM
jgi:hypothetical protein